MEDMVGKDDTGRSQAIDLATIDNISVSPAAQPSQRDDAKTFESPVDSCTSEMKILTNDRLDKKNSSLEAENCLNQNELFSALISLSKPIQEDSSMRKDPNGYPEEASDGECHLFIELASQTDDPDDLLEADEKVAEFQSDECVSKRHSELEYYLESLNQTPRDKTRTSGEYF